MRYDPDTAWIRSVLCRTHQGGRVGLNYECHLQKGHAGEVHESIQGKRWTNPEEGVTWM